MYVCMYIATIWVVIFKGLKFRVMSICYKLKIFMDIKFCECFISCVLLYLPKYVTMENMYIAMEVWEPIHGQILQCQQCLFAVSIINDGEIVGHVPKRISATCALFLQHHWSIRLMCRYIAI